MVNLSSVAGIRKSLNFSDSEQGKPVVLSELEGCVVGNSGRLSSPVVATDLFKPTSGVVGNVFLYNNRTFCTIDADLCEIVNDNPVVISQNFGSDNTSFLQFGGNIYAANGLSAVIISSTNTTNWSVFSIEQAESDNRVFIVPGGISKLCSHGSLVVAAAGQFVYFSEPWTPRLFDEKNFIGLDSACIGLFSHNEKLFLFSERYVYVISGMSIENIEEVRFRIDGRYIGHVFVDSGFGLLDQLSQRTGETVVVKTDKCLFVVDKNDELSKIIDSSDVDFNESVPFVVDGYLLF